MLPLALIASLFFVLIGLFTLAEKHTNQLTERANGRYRKAAEEDEGSTADVSNSGGGATQLAVSPVSYPIYTSSGAAAAARAHRLAQAQASMQMPGMWQHHSLAQMSSTHQMLLAQQQMLAFQQARSSWPNVFIDAAEPVRHEPLPRENKFGEIIGYRAWKVLKGGILQSCVMDNIWLPGEPMIGAIANEHEAGDGGGIHAYSRPEDKHHYASEGGSYTTYALGSVALYGDVVEHEKGYRASHAMIHTIDAVWPPNDALLSKLKARYERKPDSSPARSKE